jgi:RHS repeat-associated protein
MQRHQLFALLFSALGALSAYAADGGSGAGQTATTLSATPNPATTTSSVTLTATVNPIAAGSIIFKADGQVLGTALVIGDTTQDCNPPDASRASGGSGAAAVKSSTKLAASRTATATTSNCSAPYPPVLVLAPGSLAAGVHSLTASFESDDGNFGNSESNSLSLTVTAPGGAVLPAPPSSPQPVARYEYDAEGNSTKTTVAPDGRALATRHGYDTLGRRTNTTDAKNGITQFGYDLQDQLTTVTDPRSLVTQYQPTGLGDIKQLTSPDTGVATSTFDAAGNLKTRTDSRGVLATYTYDALNRARQVVYSRASDSARTVSWTYDQSGASFGAGVGRLTTAATPDATTTFRYDDLGRVTMTMQSSPAANVLVVNTGYDAAGNITSLTYPSGRIVSINWANGQPKSISITFAGGTAPLLDQVVMSPFGPVQSWVWRLAGTTKPHERVYDTNGRLVRHPLGPLVRDLTYDDADRISRYTHYDAATAQPATSFDQTFGYDDLNRLISVGGGTSYSYGYDANGNRTASAIGITARGYSTSSASNRLDSLSGPLRTMGYDSAGNTLNDVQSGSSSNFSATYSLEGRLAAMTQGTSVGVDFGYDAMGRRIMRGQWMGSPSNPRAYTFYAYDQASHLIGEYKADGTPVTEYVWFGDTPVAIIKTNPNDANAIQVFAIHADHLDTPRVILDAQGNVRWRWMGEPFGASPAEEQPTAGLPALQQSLRFAGQQYESFGGRHYNHFRDYDPTTGRYVQSDPIGLDGGINTYSYVEGNPLNLVDPEGLNPAAVCRAFSFGFRVGEEIIEPAVRPYVTAGVEWVFGDPMLKTKPRNNSPAKLTPAERRQFEYERAKDRCDRPIEPGPDRCSTLSKQIDQAEDVIRLYEAFDAKYGITKHAKKIEQWKNRIKALKDEHNKDCNSCK